MPIRDKDLIPLMRHKTHTVHKLGSNQDEVTFEKEEVVWILQVTNRKTGKSRPVTPSDLSRTNVEHKSAEEELSGSLGLVTLVNKRRKTAKLCHVTNFLFYDFLQCTILL